MEKQSCNLSTNANQQADIQLESDWDFANRILKLIKDTKESRERKLNKSQKNFDILHVIQRDKVNI